MRSCRRKIKCKEAELRVSKKRNVPDDLLKNKMKQLIVENKQGMITRGRLKRQIEDLNNENPELKVKVCSPEVKRKMIENKGQELKNESLKDSLVDKEQIEKDEKKMILKATDLQNDADTPIKHDNHPANEENAVLPDLIEVDTVPPFPDDIWRILITYLGLKESCSLALVCKKMTVRARYHKEWRNLTLNWNKMFTTVAAQLFSLPNFKMVKKLIITGGYHFNISRTDYNTLVTDLLQCSLTCERLEEIEVGDSVKYVNDELLAGALSKLTGVSIRGDITDRIKDNNIQLDKIIEKALCTKKLLKLSLTNITLKNVELLGDMVTQLNELEVSSLTTEDAKPLLNKCLQSETLKRLYLRGHDLTKIPSETLAGICAKLYEVSLPHCQLSREQVTNFLKACTTSSTLKVIDVTCWDLSHFSPKLLSLAFSKLSEVIMLKTRINEDHFTEIVCESFWSSKFKKLSFFDDDGIPIHVDPVKTIEVGNSEPRQLHLRLSSRCKSSVEKILTNSLGTSCLYKLDLTGIPLSAVLLPTLICILPQLQTINLCKTNLTTRDANSILTALQKSTKIRKLDLCENRLTEVSADLLSDVADKLDEIVVEACGLTKEQSSKLLHTSAICNLNLNDLSSLNKEDIYKNMERNKIYDNTSLNTLQITFMLETFCEEQDHLWEFCMRHQNLSNVPFDLLSRFALKCGRVTFDNCKLTKHQELILEKSAKPQWKQLVT